MNILLKPVITEKMTHHTDTFNRYGFLVDKRANKLQIKTAVERAYGVTVISVNTLNGLGKKRSRYTKRSIIHGKTNDYKKAVVTLSSGDSIDFYTNM